MQTLTRARTCTTRLTRTLATSSPCSQNKPTSPTLSPEDHSGTLEYAPLPTPRTPLSAYSLPDTKLRALIDLYHSSSSFITPETLSDEIDKAFAPVRYIGPPFRPESYRNLVDLRDERAVEPDRVVPSANELGGLTRFEGVGAGWSASKGERARMVKAALWGVDPMAKIGLETLLEAKAEMDSQEGVQETTKEQKTPKE